jgi:hypothetical protein
MADTLLTDLHVRYIQNLGKVCILSQSKSCPQLNVLAAGQCLSLQHKDDLTYHMTSHLRMNAVYWGLTALCIMKHKEALDAEEMIEYVMTCWDDEAGALPPSLYQIVPPPLCFCPAIVRRPLTQIVNKGAFGAHPGHDAHILSTLSAIQILATHDALSRLDTPRVIDCPSAPPFSLLTSLSPFLYIYMYIPFPLTQKRIKY